MVGTHFPVFLPNQPLCPCAPLGVGEDKHTEQSNVTCRPRNKSRPPEADWQSHACCPLSVLHCTSAKCHPHTHRLPHRSNEKRLRHHEGRFPNLASQNHSQNSHLQKGKVKKILPCVLWARHSWLVGSKTEFYVLNNLDKKHSTRKQFVFVFLKM